MLSGEQAVAWLDAVQSIRMARGEGPPAVLGRCCNRGDWKPEYDGVKLHVSRPLLIATIWMVVLGVCELDQARPRACECDCMRSAMQNARVPVSKVDSSHAGQVEDSAATVHSDFSRAPLA